MARDYYRDPVSGNLIAKTVKVEDTLPVGTIVEYNGQNIPEGWVDIGNGKIEKQYQVIPTNAKLENGDSTSATNGYTAEYINDHSVVVSAVEPSGSARKKVWKRHSSNLAPINNFEDASKECKVQIFNLIEEETLNLNYKKTRIAGVTITNNQLWAYKNADTYFVLKDNTTVSLGTPELVALTNGSHTFSKTLTIPSNVAYLQINFNNNNGDTNPNTKVEDIMLSYGSTALPYEPYADDKEYILDNDVYEEFDTNNDTGLVNVSLNSGFTGTLTVRKVGKTVNVIGTSIAGNFVGGTAFATIPEGFRPPDQINYVGRNVTNESMFLMNQNKYGDIRSLTSFSNATLQFSFTYLVD